MSGKSTTPPALRAGVIEALRTVAGHAQETREWVVVVCPDGSEFLELYRNGAGSVLPAEAHLAGRTAVLPGGGKVSVVAVGDDPFVPEGTPFTVVFLGWGDDVVADNRRMQLWRQRAARVLR